MRLHFYFARKFAKSFFGLSAVFILLTTLIDLVEQLRRLGNSSASFGQLVELTLLNAPDGYYTILPLVMILATVVLFLGLARSSELVVVRASGRSALSTLIAPVLVALMIGLVAISVLNPIVAATSKRFAQLFEFYSSGSEEVLSISSEGLWLRQADAEGQTVIRAARANPQATILYDVSFISYGPNGPVRRIEAQSAALDGGQWQLTDATVWPLTAGTNPQASMRHYGDLDLASSLTNERILEGFGTPSSISIWDLPDHIGQLSRAGFSARRHAVWFQMELAKPLFLIAMVLVAAAFTMRHVRFGKTGVAVLSAVMLGFGLYYVRNFAQIMGENGQIPIILAAWAPPVASVMLGLGILLHMEDG